MHINKHKTFRLFWIAMIIGCVVTLRYMMASQLIFLQSHPVVVNIDVIYNETLQYPAVTICNQNVFR